MQNQTMRILAAAVIGSSLITLAGAQDSGEKMSPELKVLNRFVGQWDETVVLKPAAWTPEQSRQPAHANGFSMGT